MNCQSECASDAIGLKFEIPGKSIGKLKLHGIEKAGVKSDDK
jgi:hypothetical protein